MTQQNRQPVGMGVEDLGQGGIFEAVLTVKSAKFGTRQFDGGNANFGVTMTYTKDDGNDVEWSYSVGDATAWEATPDGLGAIAIREGGKISKSSAFGVFLTELVNAGFPAPRVTSSLDFLFGTVFQSKSFVPEGTNMEGGARKAILTPGLIVSLPGEVAGQVAGKAVSAPPMPPTPSAPALPPTPAAPPVAAPVAANGIGDAGSNALMSALKLGDSFTLQGVMAQVMQDLATDPVARDAAAGYAFTPEFTQMLTGAGYTVDSYNVSK